MNRRPSLRCASAVKSTQPVEPICDEQPHDQPFSPSSNLPPDIGTVHRTVYTIENQSPLLRIVRHARCKFLEARIIPERIEHRIEPEQRGSERHRDDRTRGKRRNTATPVASTSAATPCSGGRVRGS